MLFGDEHLAVRIMFINSSLDQVLYGDSGDCVVNVHIGRFINFVIFFWILSILL